jgi:hypothetical protein
MHPYSAKTKPDIAGPNRFFGAGQSMTLAVSSPAGNKALMKISLAAMPGSNPTGPIGAAIPEQ